MRAAALCSAAALFLIVAVVYTAARYVPADLNDVE